MVSGHDVQRHARPDFRRARLHTLLPLHYEFGSLVDGLHSGKLNNNNIYALWDGKDDTARVWLHVKRTSCLECEKARTKNLFRILPLDTFKGIDDLRSA